MRPRPLALVLAVLVGAAAAEGVTLRTNRAKALVPLEEIIPGGPPPDGIPAIDRPVFVAPAVAAKWLHPREPVLAVDINGDARAYPLQILVWHEIVNDVVGGVPVAVTYCPLCNSGIVFERVVGAETLDFGTSGMLYKSDLVMYDRQTHSLWAQMEGRAIDTLAGEPLVIFYREGTLSALDAAQIARSRPVGATSVWSRRVGERVLTFVAEGEMFRDRETGTTWTFLGQATAGSLTGQRLQPIQHVDAFWFAWAAFHPTTTLYEGR